VRRIVEAGRLTASSMNGQPCTFVWSSRRNVCATGRSGSNRPIRFRRVTGDRGRVRLREQVRSVSDASRAIQSMILTAWSEGVGSNWTGFNNLDEVRGWCGLPDNYHRAGRRAPSGTRATQFGNGK